MEGTVLMVLEVSQKQSYIFNEKKLKNNVMASNIIAYVTSSEFFSSKFSEYYDEKENLVYAGGGHTFLVFKNETAAKDFAEAVSFYVLNKFPGLELFIAIKEYEGDDPMENRKALSEKLEKKKSLRKASFFQTSFGIEKAGKRMSVSDQKEGYIEKTNDSVIADVNDYVKSTAVKTKGKETVNVEVAPYGYIFAAEHEKLGGDKGKNNFVAVIHIDGNQMGSRVLKLKDFIETDPDGFGKTLGECSVARKKFEIWRYYSRKFSESIDYDFKKALDCVYKDIAQALEADKIKEPKDRRYDGLKLTWDNKEGCIYFPLRKIIAAGDDICFVTEGRLGIECAVRFIEHLAKQKNDVDHEYYNACAGVAIVHQKYPFYRAYDLAEQLCGNAKKVMVDKTRKLRENTGRKDVEDGCLSAIDWHVEYGEMMGDLDEIRDRMVDLDEKDIFARPYQINAIKNVMNDNPYSGYRRIVTHFNHFADDKDKILDIAKHKQKEMRGAIKNGQKEYERFCKMNKITENLGMNASPAQVFDALESGDVFLPLE